MLLFETPQALGHRRRGETDAPTELGKAEARIVLQLAEKFQVRGVEQGGIGVAPVFPAIDRHQREYTFDQLFKASLRFIRLGDMPGRAPSQVPADLPRRPLARLMAQDPPPHVYFVVSAVFHYLGPSFAVLLFARVNILGVAWMRIVSAALIFAMWRRPWRMLGDLDHQGRRLLVAWGVVLAIMNACFYTAISRLPLGTVAAIEFLPVIALAALGAPGQVRNLLALTLAIPGVYLLTDVKLAGAAAGFAFAFANALLFSIYIVLADRVAKRPGLSGIDGLAAAMVIAAVVITPIGGWRAAPAITDPIALLAGVGVGVSSSVIPYVTDQLAMARLPRASVRADGRPAPRDRHRDRDRGPRPDPDLRLRSSDSSWSSPGWRCIARAGRFKALLALACAARLRWPSQRTIITPPPSPRSESAMRPATSLSKRTIGARTLALAAAVVSVTALGVTAAQAAGSAVKASTPACRTSGLVVWLNTNGNGTAGTIFYTLNFTNLSGRSCTLRGYPGVSAVNLGGRQLGRPATRSTGTRVRTVTIRNGGTARATVGIVDALNFPRSSCVPVTAAGLRIFPPNQAASKTTPFPFLTCSAGAASNLRIQAVR